MVWEPSQASRYPATEPGIAAQEPQSILNVLPAQPQEGDVLMAWQTIRPRRMSVVPAVLCAVLALWGPPARAVDLAFRQVSWSDNSGTGAWVSRHSDWGRVEISLSAADQGLFQPMTVGGVSGWGGFLNIVTDSSGLSDWNVSNLPIFFTAGSELDGRLPQGVLFDLGVAPSTPVTGLNYLLTVDPAPLAAMPAGALQPATVTEFGVSVGGDNLWLRDAFIEGGGQTTPQPAKNAEGAKPAEKIGSVAKIAIEEKNVAAVSEDANSCAPGSVARSIKYMAAANPSVKVTDDAQKVYGDVRTAMGTTASGTATADILSGKNTYVSNNKLPVTSTQTTDFKKAMETLKNKGDVEIGVFWGTKADGKSLGAHRAFVAEIQEIQDASGNTTGYLVKIIDDPKQGDGTAANSTTTLKFDAAGNLVQMDGKGAATGAKLINFQTEDVQPAKAPVTVARPATTRLNKDETLTPPVPVKKTGEVIGPAIAGVKTTYKGMKDKDHPGWVEYGSQLVVNREGTPGDGPSLTLSVCTTVPMDPPDPNDPTTVTIGMSLEHVLADQVTPSHFLSVLQSEPMLFLENLVATSSFFDITYMVEMPGEAPLIYRLHGEVAEPLLGKAWLLGMDPQPAGGGGGGMIDSFFDVYFDMEITPDAYGLIGVDTPVLNLELTGEQIPEPFTLGMLALGGLALLRRRK